MQYFDNSWQHKEHGLFITLVQYFDNSWHHKEHGLFITLVQYFDNSWQHKEHGLFITLVQYFAEDKSKPTIETIDPSAQNVIGNRAGLSFRDIKTMNLMYECHPRKF